MYLLYGDSELQAKLYACQVILAFEYLQALDIIYRDLKPENILIDPAGNLKVSCTGASSFLLCRTKRLWALPDFYRAALYARGLSYGKGVRLSVRLSHV